VSKAAFCCLCCPDRSCVLVFAIISEARQHHGLLFAFPVCTINYLCVFTASAGAAAGGIIYFVSYLPFTFFGVERRYPDVTANAKFGISLVPTLAMAIGCKNLAQFESMGV